MILTLYDNSANSSFTILYKMKKFQICAKIGFSVTWLISFKLCLALLPSQLLSTWVNALKQALHLWGFSPVWVRMWLLRVVAPEIERLTLTFSLLP